MLTSWNLRQENRRHGSVKLGQGFNGHRTISIYIPISIIFVYISYRHCSFILSFFFWTSSIMTSALSCCMCALPVYHTNLKRQHHDIARSTCPEVCFFRWRLGHPCASRSSSYTPQLIHLWPGPQDNGCCPKKNMAVLLLFWNVLIGYDRLIFAS